MTKQFISGTRLGSPRGRWVNHHAMGPWGVSAELGHGGMPSLNFHTGYGRQGGTYQGYTIGYHASNMHPASHPRMHASQIGAHGMLLSSPPGVQVCNLDAFYTDLMWYPVSSKKNQAGGTDVFAVSCTDGEQQRRVLCTARGWAD